MSPARTGKGSANASRSSTPAARSRSTTPATRKSARMSAKAGAGSTIDDAIDVDALLEVNPSADFGGLTADEGGDSEADADSSSGNPNAKKRRGKGKRAAKAHPGGSKLKDTDSNMAPPAPPASRPSAFQPFRRMLPDDMKIDDFEDETMEEGEVDEGVSLVYEVDTAEVNPAPAPSSAVDPAPAPSVSTRAPAPKAAPKAVQEDDDAAAANTSVLLLPDNVHVAEGSDDDEDDAADVPMEGVHMVDDNNTRGASRYWMDTESDLAHFLAEADQSKVCRNCKKPGHIASRCPHTVCNTCGALDEHERKDCPWSVLCFGCGQRGHRKQECPAPANRQFKRGGCDRCGVWDHRSNSCPSVWRVYVYRKNDDRERVMEEKANVEGWTKQVVGGNPSDRFCYNCAQNSHFGDDCPQQRGSLARAVVNSAFSENVAGRGPYALDAFVVRGGGKHTRWDDELPYAAAGFKGGNAGAKTVQKARQAHRQSDRDRDRSDRQSDRYGDWNRGRNERNEARDDWFANRSSGNVSTPITGAGRQGWDSERRSRDDYGRYGRDRGGEARGYDSERRRSRSPDRRSSHGSYHPAPPRISIGNSSMSALGARMGMSPGAYAYDSPSARRAAQTNLNSSSNSGSGSRGGGGGGGGGGGNKPSSKSAARSGRKSDTRRDDAFEERWRASGAGGGNVASWGDDIGQQRDNRPKAGPVRGARAGAGAGAGAKGQRYTGGY